MEDLGPRSGSGSPDRTTERSSDVASDARPRRPKRAAPRIRGATPGDARALSEVMASVYAEGRWFVGDGAPLPDTLARRLRALDARRELFLVAELPASELAPCEPSRGRRGACVVGWIDAHRYLPERLDHVVTFTLAVAERARRRGVGRALLRSLPTWAERVGARKIRLDVRAENLAARTLYEREGFVVEGVEKRQVRCLGEDGQERFEDNVLMARFL